jgi:hypothetical protein
MTEQKKLSCLSDRPVQKKDTDKLENMHFVEGLYSFIMGAETPITIGIQGGWGSGKTSLINMLEEKIKSENPRQAIYVFVNAWEHALFQHKEAKLEVTVNLLTGLFEAMKTAIEEKEYNIQEIIKKEVVGQEGIFAKLKSLSRSPLLWGSMSAASKMFTGADWVQDIKPGASEQSVTEFIQVLRNKIADAVQKITNNSDIGRFVCFIDDLDRVPPEIAVEILDVTKNIFAIEHYIFVLAIDYDVVVKGLEGKFGKKDKENEREFRQYFDKIIQIPFHMPVGAYKKHLVDLLRSSFETLGYHDLDQDVLENISTAALAATDGVPRSIKRIINTLSLLKHISPDLTDDADSVLEIRFIVIALNINFPEISRRLMENSNFIDWKINKLNKRWELNSEEQEFEEIKDAYGESFDEEWEQVVYCLCQQTLWLKAKASAVSDLLNALRKALKRRSFDKKTLSIDLLDTILQDIRVVSVENVSGGLVDNSSKKTDTVTVFCKNVHKSLLGKGKINGLPECTDKIYAKQYSGCREYLIKLAEEENEDFRYVGLFWDKDKKELLALVDLRPPSRKKTILRDCIEDNKSPKYYPRENSKFEVGVATTLCKNWIIDNFQENPNSPSIDELADKIVQFCRKMKEMRAKAIE